MEQQNNSISVNTTMNSHKNGGRVWQESKKMWKIAGPAILMLVSQYSFEFVTCATVGHLGSLELAAVSIVQNVIKGFVYGLMVIFCTFSFFLFIQFYLFLFPSMK